jgi:hypothetical protein
MKLNNDNFLMYAMHHYDNPQCNTVSEFEEDLKRFYYIKKLFSRYRADGVVRERLVLNHIIVLYNLFGDTATNMLFHKINKEDWSTLVTFLVYLNRMPEIVEFHNIKLSDIPLDESVVLVLREI